MCPIFVKRNGISIHALREEGDSSSSMMGSKSKYFYPRPPRGGRRGDAARCRRCGKFLSTPSARRATRPAHLRGLHVGNFYPRPPRGGRLPRYYEDWCSVLISIHALREEGDASEKPRSEGFCRFLSTPSARRATYYSLHQHRIGHNFYPRPPRGGRREYYNTEHHWKIFLSTPSARRATLYEKSRGDNQDISIHALREEGDPIRRFSASRGKISIHALREEGDLSIPAAESKVRNFYPRPPRGGRHQRYERRHDPWHFYPRPPRGGRRSAARPTRKRRKYFYPRPPRGGRQSAAGMARTSYAFLSTPSARRATPPALSVVY